MNRKRLGVASAGQNGFSLVELLVVVGIIGIMAIVAIPTISRYTRTYRIRTAAQEVASVIAETRGKAIARNTNRGVLFMVLAPTTAGNPTQNVVYRYVMEDDVDGGTGKPWADTDTLLNDGRQLGTMHVLPDAISFTDATLGAVNERGIRFNRLGLMCDPGQASCPAIDAGTNYIYVTADGSQAMTTLLDARNGLKSQVTVQQGGRVRITNSWTVE